MIEKGGKEGRKSQKHKRKLFYFILFYVILELQCLHLSSSVFPGHYILTALDYLTCLRVLKHTPDGPRFPYPFWNHFYFTWVSATKEERKRGHCWCLKLRKYQVVPWEAELVKSCLLQDCPYSSTYHPKNLHLFPATVIAEIISIYCG